MSGNISTSFRITTLTFSSPAFSTITRPSFFYNAFPDLNDVAPDGSRSSLPRRAKYLLPLHCTFNPGGTFQRDGKYHSLTPRDPKTEGSFDTLNVFEWVH